MSRERSFYILKTFIKKSHLEEFEKEELLKLINKLENGEK